MNSATLKSTTSRGECSFSKRSVKNLASLASANAENEEKILL